MELKNGYKQSEIGVIPDDWGLDIIKHHCSITTGNKNTQDRVDNGMYPFFVRSQTVEKINSYSFDGEAVLTAGDGVGTGKIYHYLNGKFDFHQRVYKMSDFSEKLDGYFFYLYFSNHFYSRISQMTAKSSVDSVRMEMIADMKIPLPPTKKEQTVIAITLSDTDTWIQSLIRLIAKKRQIKQGAIQTLLNPYENGRLKEGWDFISYGNAFDFLATASYSRAELSSSEECGYIHYGDIHTTWNEFIDFERHSVPKIAMDKTKGYALIKNGDIVMADASEDYAGIGKSVEIKALGSRKVISGLHTFLLRDKSESFVDGYKGYLHLSNFVKKQFDRLATGLKVYGMSKGNLKQIEIPRPPKQEQISIASIISVMDEEIASLTIKLKKAQQIKQGMMQNLLTGRIRLI